jgi:membrane-bound metal-dependent hydrolase YbcI (DUF457 family)
VLVGAILPDLIDKPLSLMGFGGGRTIAHTLLFACIVTAVVSTGFQRARAMPWLVLSFGVWTHLLLDMMWDVPGVLLWPTLGLDFPVHAVDTGGLLHMLLTNPYIYGGEIVGSILILGIAVKNSMYTKVALRRFLSRGMLE